MAKDDPDAVELGTLPEVTGPKKQKMQMIIEKLVEGCTITEICKSDLCHVFVTNKPKIMSTVAQINAEKNREKCRDKAWGSIKKFREWQSMLMKILEDGKGNDRIVYWVYEKDGGVGKTYFCNHLKQVDFKNVAYLDTSSARDLSLLYQGERIVLLDFARDEKNKVDYCLLEKLKNGFL